MAARCSSTRSARCVDVRIVSATNQPLEEQAATGRFRQDLLYRLNAVTIRIPPLRERGGDALLLARMFLTRFSREGGRRLRGFDAAATEAIMAHPWPGNVRELENRVRRAALMADGPAVTPEDLDIAPAGAANDIQSAIPDGLDLRAARQRVERELIERALARSNNSLAAAARLLGISRPTLYSLLETYGMETPRAAGLAAANQDAG